MKKLDENDNQTTVETVSADHAKTQSAKNWPTLTKEQEEELGYGKRLSCEAFAYRTPSNPEEYFWD